MSHRGGFRCGSSSMSSSRAATSSSRIASSLEPEPETGANDVTTDSPLPLPPPPPPPRPPPPPLPVSPDGRWVLSKNAKGLIASHKKMSSTITKTFHKFGNPTGFSWKLTPKVVKNNYFEEFRRYFSWPSDWETAVYEKWESRARVRYSDMLHDIKELRGENDSGRPSFITEEMWKGLCAYWDTPEVIAWSEAARKCRLSEPDGPGIGYRSHRGGSKSVEILAQEMAEREGIPLEKCVYPSFRAIHVNKDGTYRSKKAEKIDTKVKAIATERGEGADLNEIYMEVNRDELRKKQRMYGTGSLASTLLRDNSTATHQVHHCDSRLEEVEKQLQAERERRLLLEERFRATQETVQLLLSRQDSRTLGDHNSPAPSR